jgi:hypothetical protein
MPKLLFSIGVMLLISSACSSVPKRAGELATDEHRAALQTRFQKELGLSIEVEDPMPNAALLSISNALFVPKWYKFRQVRAGHPFLRFFGSNSLESVYGFLKERVHHLGVMRPDLEISAKFGHVYAANTGSALWQLKEINYVDAIRLGGNRVDLIDSPRYGLIELSPSTLVEAKEAQEGDADRFLHLAVFVHEARHSDCSGGVDRSLMSDRKALPPSCTYVHVVCKNSSEAEKGVLACDRQFWGAYSAEYVVLDAIADSCIDCNKPTRWLLKYYAIESASRINLLPETLLARIQKFWEKSKSRANLSESESEMNELIAEINVLMMSKQLPEPDLTSGTVTN